MFIRHEGRAKLPLIDLSLFRESREFSRACIAFTAYFAALPVQLFVLPLVLISAMEFSAWDTGMTLAVIAVSTTLISPAAGKLAARFGAGRLAVGGAVLTALGYVALLPISADHGQLALMPAMLLLGVGSALFFAPNNALMMGNVPPRALVTAAGLIGVLRQSGYAAGFAMIASLVTAIQDNIEEIWTAASTAHLDAATAAGLADLFEGGGIWSPEILLFAMRVGVLIAVAILAISIININIVVPNTKARDDAKPTIRMNTFGFEMRRQQYECVDIGNLICPNRACHVEINYLDPRSIKKWACIKIRKGGRAIRFSEITGKCNSDSSRASRILKGCSARGAA